MMPSITEAIGDVVKTLVSVACEFSARYPADTEDVDIYSFRFRRHSSGSCGDSTLQRRYKPPVEGCCNCQINDLSVYSLKRRGSGCKVGRCGTRFLDTIYASLINLYCYVDFSSMRKVLCMSYHQLSSDDDKNMIGPGTYMYMYVFYCVYRAQTLMFLVRSISLS